MKKFLSFSIMIIVGIAIGVFIGKLFAGFSDNSTIEQATSGNSSITGVVAFVAILVGYFLHLMVHEAGHLVAGLLSTYKFVSFRILNLTLIKENGKLTRKKFNIVGTTGQCLMSPPDDVDGAFPTVLYNLGGSLMNFLISGICFIGFFLTFKTTNLVANVFTTSAIMGTIIGLTNIIPIKISGIATDGHNTITLSKNKKARRAFWVQLRINAMVTQGFRYSDLPSAWFEPMGSEDYSDPILASFALFRYSYLMDSLEISEGRLLAEKILSTASKMLEIHKNELRCELLFHELIGECRRAEVERLHTNALKKYINATSSYMSRQRLLYAYARLFLNDDLKAKKALELFERAVSCSPFIGEIAGEKELISIIDDKALQCGLQRC